MSGHDALPRLWLVARSVWPELLLLSCLRFVWLIAFPLVFYWAGPVLLSLLPIAVGVVFDAAAQWIAQRLRRSVRVACLTRSAEDALDKASPAPRTRTEAAFWSAHLTEFAVIVDVPTILAAAAALLGIGILSLLRLGAALVLPLSLVFVIAGVLTLYANRTRVRLLGEVVAARGAAADLVGAAEHDSGEIMGAVARKHYVTNLAQAASAWCRAEDRFELRRLLHRFLIGGFVVASALFVSARHGFDLSAPARAADVTMRSALDLLLLGSALPIARVLASHFDSVLVGYTALSELELAPVRARPAPQRLATPPRRLVLRALKHSYAGKLSLDAGDAEVDLARPVLVRGQNGAGKTTLVALLAGTFEPSAGSVHFDGIDARALSPDDVAFVPQHPTFVAELSILTNLRLVAPDASEDELKLVLEELGAPHLLSHGAGRLSRGEQQRLALVRALVKRPKLLILDEPDAWLDADGRARLFAALERRRQHMAIVIVTHRDELIPLAGTTVEIVDGHRLRTGEPAHEERSTASGSSSA